MTVVGSVIMCCHTGVDRIELHKGTHSFDFRFCLKCCRFVMNAVSECERRVKLHLLANTVEGQEKC